MINSSNISIRTDSFDGPLGLLLLLVQKEEMDIRSLDVTKITNQYLDYILKMQELNFDVAGDYLFLAATLLLLKSKSCLTDEDFKELLGEGVDEELAITSKAELIKRLEELQRFQRLGERLWTLNKLGHEDFKRSKVQKKNFTVHMINECNSDDLVRVMLDLMFRERRKYKVLKRDRLTIKEKLESFKSKLNVGDKRTLKDLLEYGNAEDIRNSGKNTNLIITFISILELARLKRLSVYQNEAMGDIYVEVTKSLNDFDVNQADGFDPEDGQSNDQDLEEHRDDVVERKATHEAPPVVQ